MIGPSSRTLNARQEDQNLSGGIWAARPWPGPRVRCRAALPGFGGVARSGHEQSECLRNL